LRTTGLILFVLLALGANLSAAPNTVAERTPAGFGDDPKALGKLIVFPKGSTNVETTIRCQGLLKASGRLSDRGCFRVQRQDPPFVKAIEKAAKRARFSPARLNGRNVGIYFQYQVRFTRVDEEETITFYANQAYPENVDAYGEDHVVAQRTVIRETWPSVCPSRARFLVIARAHVADDGSQSDIAVTHGNGIPISNRCKQAIVETMEQSPFIPAYADGEPVPSSYMEAFGN